MASSSSAPSAPAFSSRSWKYHVFLSFRGKDTRNTFVAHLYAALEQEGIYTYRDDETLSRGKTIHPSLMKAIEESLIAVITFSKNYADSSWCLDELEHIMKCKDSRGKIVMPVFYDVEPSEVRKQNGNYGKALAKLELEKKNKFKSWRQAFVDDPWGWLFAPWEQKRRYKEAFVKHELENKKKFESWRKALKDAGDISGWEPSKVANGDESKCIKEIVVKVSQKLQLLTPRENENLIGMAARMQHLKSELEIRSGGVRMIGIWGVGGGGKTTLASSIYDEICRQFDKCCFVQNIREQSSRHGLGKLEEDILSQMGVTRVGGGRCMIKDRLCYRKVLIVLDDVDHLDQLKALAGSHDWFGEGSRIIITTRDKHLLTAHNVNVIHEMSLLNSDEAIKLFCKHAPRDNRPVEDYEHLSKEVVSYAGGLPLALTVLGSFLCDKDVNEWKSALLRLKEIPDTDIVEKLKISFDGLKPVEKELFLDIACFYRWTNTETAMEKLDACGFHPVIGVKRLIEKALIKISKDGVFDMHDLVQKMGHHIVRGEHANNPEKHSRVWKEEDVLKICAMDATAEVDMIEAIIFPYNMAEPLHRLPQIVAKMKNLRLIECGGDLASQLPTNFSPRKLCCLVLSSCSPKQFWEGYKLLPNLKMMELWCLENLIRTPEFDGLPNLERLRFESCQGFEEIHPSIGHLERLVFLSIEQCSSLKMFPPITSLKKLVTLSIIDCYQLFKPSEIQQQNMDDLGYLDSDNSGDEVASYIESSPNVFINCWRCGCNNLPGVECFCEIQQQNVEDLGDLDSDNSRDEVASYIESSPNVFINCWRCGCNNLPGVECFCEIQQQNVEDLGYLDLDDSRDEVASFIETSPNIFVDCWRCSCSNLPGVECCLEDPSSPHNNIKHLGLLNSLKDLRNLNLSGCSLGDEEMGSAVWELPNLNTLDLSGNAFSRLSFNLLRLPRLKRLDVSRCPELVQLSDLPSSIAVVKAYYCWSLESFGDISNCKWLWNVSLQAPGNKLDVEILLDSMLQGNASEDYFIQFILEDQIPKRFAGRLFWGTTVTLRLPDDWYNDFCGFLICIVTNDGYYRDVDIIMKQEVDEDSLIEVWHESNETVEPEEEVDDDYLFEVWQDSNEAVEPVFIGTKTYVGYVSFGSLRDTPFSISSHTLISAKIEDVANQGYREAYMGFELVPRKSKGDQPQTPKVATDSSEFCDNSLPFRIQHDSKSSITIKWKQWVVLL